MSNNSSADGDDDPLCLAKRLFVTPLRSEAEALPNLFRGFVYGVAMAYFFLGIAIISDIFMGAIEAVTSWRKKVQLTDGRRVTQKVWNDTVSTLSLMALGSSAPEIFLAVIELFKREMHSGDLGPSTIVGSASFNLFVIIAVCIVAIPDGEDRVIANTDAFFVTAIFSVGAYMWLVFILTMHTRNMVDITEAFATFIGLPILIWVSYSVDVGFLGKILAKLRGQAEEEEEDVVSGPRLAFSTEGLIVKRSRDSETQTLTLVVQRSGSTKGEASCNYRTEAFTAVTGYDFTEAEGQLEFEDGAQQVSLSIDVLPTRLLKPTREFFVILEEAEGASFHPGDDGGEEASILTVTVETEFYRVSLVDQMVCSLDFVVNLDHFRLTFDEWIEGIFALRYVNGSAEEQAEASWQDVVYHVLSFPWMVLFQCIPPTKLFGGWAAFVVAIGGIGVLTGIVSDLAELFGCVLAVPGIITAVTFVALGTSMPDLFASVGAASDDPTADAAIVNVTGSNSVNVFLGLGLPWTIAAYHWSRPGARTADWEMRYPEIASKIEGAAFVVESRNLGFSVLVFSSSCVVALLLLVLRRKVLGCELGGPFWPRWSSAAALVTLWLAFVALTGWRVLRCEGAREGDFCKAAIMEQATVVFSTGFLVFAVTMWPIVSIFRHRKTAGEEAEEETATDEAGDAEGAGGPAAAESGNGEDASPAPAAKGAKSKEKPRPALNRLPSTVSVKSIMSGPAQASIIAAKESLELEVNCLRLSAGASCAERKSPSTLNGMDPLA